MDDGKIIMVHNLDKLDNKLVNNKEYTIYTPSDQTRKYYISQTHDNLINVINNSRWITGKYKGLNEFGKHTFLVVGFGDVPIGANYLVFEGVRTMRGGRRRSQRRRRNQRKTRRLL